MTGATQIRSSPTVFQGDEPTITDPENIYHFLSLTFPKLGHSFMVKQYRKVEFLDPSMVSFNHRHLI